MLAVMYHYVRPGPRGEPFLRYLDLGDFRRQLDELARQRRFLSREDFLAAMDSDSGVASSDGVVLTFDDGLSDHLDYVVPELVRRGIWGIFYVPTGQYTNGRWLLVHRVHRLLAEVGATTVSRRLQNLVTADDLDTGGAPTGGFAYRGHANEPDATQVKRLLNYQVRPDRAVALIDLLTNELLGGDLPVEDRYIPLKRLTELTAAGMTVGSHGVSHRVLARLSAAEQEAEIAESFDVLDSVMGPAHPRTFCYPYGGRDTFSAETSELLERYGCRFSFTAEPREIDNADLRHPQALPRLDCNRLPFGRASGGERPS